MRRVLTAQRVEDFREQMYSLRVPDPETGVVKKLFTKHRVETVEFKIDADEWDFYDALK